MNKRVPALFGLALMFSLTLVIALGLNGTNNTLSNNDTDTILIPLPEPEENQTQEKNNTLSNGTANQTQTEPPKPEKQASLVKCDRIVSPSKCMLRPDCRYNVTTRKCIEGAVRARIKERVLNFINQSDCPENCTCAGSTIKCQTENGREITVVAGRSGNVIVMTQGVNASTKVVLIKNGTATYGNFSGKVRIIKIMPDEVKEKIMEKAKMKQCETCNITLNEDGNYEMKFKNNWRILGIFPASTASEARVDAETGEIGYLNVKKPWWSFISVKGKN